MRVLFTVQGEGRGHMTQALAVRQILSRWGHEVVAAVFGRHGSRTLPEYVRRDLAAPIEELPSPGFVFHRGRAVNLSATAAQCLAGYREWRGSLARLREIVAKARPDLIVNFFEPLTGLAQLRRPFPAPVVSVAHQHMIGHPAHRTPLARRVDQSGLKLFADLVGYRSHKLALSLYPAAAPAARGLTVGPPLLRRELFTLSPTPGDHYLVYLVNHGYHEDVREWHRANPEVKLRCFYDRPGAPDEERVGSNLVFHRLHGERFLRCMASCRAVATTAGFESVSEAAWLGKPLLAVPVEGHAEQQWNARDAEQAGLATVADRFDLDQLRALPERVDNGWFHAWLARAEEILLEVISGNRGA